MVSTICRQHQWMENRVKINLIPNMNLQVLQGRQESLSKAAFLTRVTMGA